MAVCWSHVATPENELTCLHVLVEKCKYVRAYALPRLVFNLQYVRTYVTAHADNASHALQIVMVPLHRPTRPSLYVYALYVKAVARTDCRSVVTPPNVTFGYL